MCCSWRLIFVTYTLNSLEILRTLVCDCFRPYSRYLPQSQEVADEDVQQYKNFFSKSVSDTAPRIVVRSPTKHIYFTLYETHASKFQKYKIHILNKVKRSSSNENNHTKKTLKSELTLLAVSQTRLHIFSQSQLAELGARSRIIPPRDLKRLYNGVQSTAVIG